MVSFNPLIISLIPLLLAVFWIWMFWDFMQNDRIPRHVRPYWIVGFLFVGIVTAGYYFFTEYQHK